MDRSTFVWAGGRVSGAWHHPSRGKTYLLLGHGAGGTMHTSTLVQFAEGLADKSIGVVRFNFPYAEARRNIPDRQAALVQCYRAVAERVAGQVGRLYLGGRSMGGRIASHVVADGFPAAGLLFLSYPLHPPGRPERLRTSHLQKIRVPMLFLQGSRDAFAKPDLLRQAVASLPTATLHVVEGADHGLRVKGRAPEEVTHELVEAAVAWMQMPH